MSMNKAKKQQLTLSNLEEHVISLYEGFRSQIPFNAWRFFARMSTEIEFFDGKISFNEADFFSVNEADFRECLEFWVTQSGGTIKWDKEKK